jgi:hypothetical protein
MKNIIVYCLWGSDNKYWKGAVENIKLAKIYYPDFICRFYVDNKCDENLIDTLKGDNVEVVILNGERNIISLDERFTHNGIFWRFLPLKDKEINVILSRDCDSRISKREAEAVKQWLTTNMNFHIMRDHPYHQVPILAGMWGCKNNILSNIDELLDKWINFNNKGKFQAEDQDFLGQFIYPIVKNSALEHSEFNISFGNNIYRFPTIRENYEFIGDVFDENNNRHPDYWKKIN